jgi:hypothetical protein
LRSVNGIWRCRLGSLCRWVLGPAQRHRNENGRESCGRQAVARASSHRKTNHSPPPNSSVRQGASNIRFITAWLTGEGVAKNLPGNRDCANLRFLGHFRRVVFCAGPPAEVVPRHAADPDYLARRRIYRGAAIAIYAQLRARCPEASVRCAVECRGMVRGRQRRPPPHSRADPAGCQRADVPSGELDRGAEEQVFRSGRSLASDSACKVALAESGADFAITDV